MLTQLSRLVVANRPQEGAAAPGDEQATSGMKQLRKREAEGQALQQVAAKRVAVPQAGVAGALAGANQALQSLKDIARHRQRQWQSANIRAANLELEVITCNQALQDLQQAALATRPARFGATALLQLIDTNIQRFSRRPLGPFGAIITVTHERWRVPAEVVLGGVLRDFVVSSEKDAQLLRELMVEVGYRGRPAMVHVRDFDGPLPVRRPADSRPSLLGVLVVDPLPAAPVVLDCLVHKLDVGNILVFENGQQGREMMYGPKPAARRSGIDIDGHTYVVLGGRGMSWVDRNWRVRAGDCRLEVDTKTMAALHLEHANAAMRVGKERLAVLLERYLEAMAEQRHVEAELARIQAAARSGAADIEDMGDADDRVQQHLQTQQPGPKQQRPVSVCSRMQLAVVAEQPAGWGQGVEQQRRQQALAELRASHAQAVRAARERHAAELAQLEADFRGELADAGPQGAPAAVLLADELQEELRRLQEQAEESSRALARLRAQL